MKTEHNFQSRFVYDSYVYFCSLIQPQTTILQPAIINLLLEVSTYIMLEANHKTFSYGNNISVSYIKLLKPAGHVMHQQFNIQQLYTLPTLYLCVLYLSENKQRLVPLTA